MIISIVSPVHGQAGNTTAAILLGLLLSKTQGKSVCLTHLSPKSSAFFTYLGLDSLTDKTCTPSQVVKLMREGAISPEEMTDYCMRVNDNLDIFSNNSKAFSDEDMELTARYIIENMPHDFVVIDIDINTEQPLAKYALEKSDLVIITLTQSLNVLERYGEVFGEETKKDKLLYLCNNYSSIVGSIGNFAKPLHIKPSDCCPLHYSEMIMKLSNTGNLGELLKIAKEQPLFDTEADLKRLTFAVMSHFKLRGVWK